MSENDIQDFLRKVEEHLTDLPQSERLSALDEWRETFRRYHQAQPQTNTLRLKRLLGGPRGLANIIRLQHQLPLKGSPAQTTRQAVLIIIASGLLMFCLLIGFIWYKFTPIVSVEQNRLQALGGFIDIDNQLGQLKVGDSFQYSPAQYSNVFEGSYDVSDEVEDVIIEFDRGQMELTYTAQGQLSWSCKTATEPGVEFIKQEKEALTVSMQKAGGSDCTFKLPARLKYTVNGDAGKVDVISPANDTFVQLGSGAVYILPDSELKYRFDLKVGQGTVDDELTRLSKDGGIEIKVDVGTGSVELQK